MTRGQLIAIAYDDNGVKQYYRSTEFNGNMYPSGLGAEIIERFSLGDIETINDFCDYVANFDKNNFRYSSGNVEDIFGIVDLASGEWNYWYEKLKSFENFLDIRKYTSISDYTYWMNLTDEDIEVATKNGIVLIPSKECAVFNYRKFYPIDQFSARFLEENEISEYFPEYKAILDLMKRFKDEDLTEEEAQELVDNSWDDRNNEWSVIYDSVEDFGRSEAESIGLESWAEDFFDFEKYGRHVLNYDDRGAYELSSGRIAAR